MKCGRLKYSDHGSGGLFRLELPLDWLLVLLIMALSMLGKMPAWSQDSGPKSNNSGGTSPAFELSLEALNSLHNQASSQLTELTQSLNQALQEVQTSKQQLTSLRNLLDNASEKLTDLENTNQRISEFNQKIGERMQERDTDLANAYDELDAQDKKILKMWIAIITMAGIYVLSSILKIVIVVLRIKFKIKLPWILDVLA
jgi:septal ring factor EnvC (AmiA/AmiB activator)